MASDAERLRAADVGLAVVDEHSFGGADTQVVQRVPVDLGLRLEQAEFAADVAGREEIAERPGPGSEMGARLTQGKLPPPPDPAPDGPATSSSHRAVRAGTVMSWPRRVTPNSSSLRSPSGRTGRSSPGRPSSSCPSWKHGPGSVLNQVPAGAVYQPDREVC